MLSVVFSGWLLSTLLLTQLLPLRNWRLGGIESKETKTARPKGIKIKRDGLTFSLEKSSENKEGEKRTCQRELKKPLKVDRPIL